MPYLTWNNIQLIFSMRLRIPTKKLFAAMEEFAIIKEIGIGSFGSVKLALHIDTNKCYAIKIIHITDKISENELLVLERQINIHSTIDHPHIIKLWDTLYEDDKIYMIMELAENGTLFAYQNKHPTISEAEVFKFFSQTLNAVRYMHEKDIMHRDLKPQNILLDNCCNVKICDLGWATDNILLKRKTFCGTYEYMAPEMVFEKEYNYAIDIWAMGVLLYELLHGYAPFPAKNLDEMKEKIKLGYYQLGNTLNKDLKNLIIDILQFEAEQRPSIKKILAHPWIDKMKREIKTEIGRIQTELRAENDKPHREKPSLMNVKKHKRFDSLANENNTHQLQNNQQSALNKHKNTDTSEQLKKGKKKCKTQGQESIEKIFNEASKLIESKMKSRKDKENAGYLKHNYGQSELCKSSALRNDQFGVQNTLKMKKIADRINEFSSKFTQKKKHRLKTNNKDQ